MSATADNMHFIINVKEKPAVPLRSILHDATGPDAVRIKLGTAAVPCAVATSSEACACAENRNALKNLRTWSERLTRLAEAA